MSTACWGFSIKRELRLQGVTFFTHTERHNGCFFFFFFTHDWVSVVIQNRSDQKLISCRHHHHHNHSQHHFHQRCRSHDAGDQWLPTACPLVAFPGMKSTAHPARPQASGAEALDKVTSIILSANNDREIIYTQLLYHPFWWQSWCFSYTVTEK